MDNATRRQLLMRHRQSGYPGSILDVFKAYDMGIDLLGQFEEQNNMQVAQTPQEQQQGLRPAHQAGNVNQSMAFPNVPPNTPFNTMGMKAPIDIKKFDEQGHLVKSYDNVPPGVQSLPTGPQRGTVIETPANMQSGGTFPQQGPDGIVVPATPPNTAQDTRPQPPQPGPRFEDTMEWIGEQYGPDQFGDTLNLTALDLVSEHRQGILRPHAVRDTIAYHETGPHQRMQPNAVQITNRGGEGVGRGMYMYDQPSTLTAANRVDDIANYMGLETPSFISDLRESNGTSRADTLSREQQDMLFMGDLIEGPAPGRAYGAGQTDIETLWYRGHNRRPDEQAAREEFRESMRGLEQDNLRNYMFLEDRPNYFERRQRRLGGPMRKYFRLRK